MKPRPLKSTIALLWLAALGCSLRAPKDGYEYDPAGFGGNGTIIDNGQGVASGRFVLTLPGVNLAKLESHGFAVVGLPEARLHGAIMVPRESGTLPAARVRIRVSDDDRNLVDEAGRLSDWNAGTCIGDTFMCLSPSVQPPATRIDWDNDGYGLAFKPRSRQRYQIRVDVLVADAVASTNAALVFVGGGWK